MTDPQLFGVRSAIKGWLSGSFILGGILGDFGVLIQIILVIIAVLLFTDSWFPYGTATYGLSSLTFFIIGIVATFFFWFAGFLTQYTTVCLAIVIIAYSVSVVRRAKNRQSFK